jgi:hypothetical protein
MNFYLDYETSPSTQSGRLSISIDSAPAAFHTWLTEPHPAASQVPTSPHAHETPADRDSTTVSFHISGIMMWHLTKFGLK